MQLKQFFQAIEVFQYAKNLYAAQGNIEWEKNTNLLLKQAENNHKPR